LKIKKKQQNIKERMRKKISTLARCTAAFSNKLYAVTKKNLMFQEKKTNVGIISSGLDKKKYSWCFFLYMKKFTNELGILFHTDKNLI